MVWVHEKTPAVVPPLDEIRQRVESEVLRERERSELIAHTQSLREKARIVLPDTSLATAP